MNVLVVAGTRPEAIKLAPVVLGLRAAGLRARIVTTGQHPDLAAQGLAAFGLAPDLALPPVPRAEEGDLPSLLAGVIDQVGGTIRRERPDLALVHGDTTSALGAGLAAHHLRVPVGHVEAGLRSGDRQAPFPEEDDRVLLDRLASCWFAPTPRARDVLLREGCDPARVVVTGNPVVDAVTAVRARVADLPCAAFPELAPLDLDAPGPVVALTAHRRESLGAPLARIAAALPALGARVVWPVHPNPEVARALPRSPRVVGCPPLSYPAMVRLLLRASLLLTDSGGLQEEAVVLGVPALVLRERTERPEVLESGLVRLVGTDTARIVAEATAWLASPPTRTAVDCGLGDGHAGARIGRWIADTLAAPGARARA